MNRGVSLLVRTTFYKHFTRECQVYKMFLCIIVGVFGFFVFCFTVFMLSYYEWHRPSLHRRCLKIPHPQLSFITGVGSELIKYPADEILYYFHKLWKSLGDVFYYPLLGIPNVMLVNPEDVEVLLSNINYTCKGAEYRFLRPALGNGLLTSSGDHWHTRRKQLTPSFHFKILEGYLSTFNEEAKNLIEELAGTGGRPIPIEPVISSCTLNIICKTAMGTSLDMMQSTAREYATTVKELLNTVVLRYLTFWWYSDWVFALSPTGRRFFKNLRKVRSFIDHVIAERRHIIFKKESVELTSESGQYKQRKSFLDFLLSIQRENPASLSDEDIRDEVNTFMAEGYDTVASATVWTLFLLANYPEVQNRARAEITEVFPADEYYDISTEDLSKLEYLEMVMKESQRLYPSVPFMSRRIPQDMKIVTGGYVIPAGVNVVVMPYFVHRNPDVFRDPEKFDPERFTPEMVKTYHPYAYIPFSAGYRNCIGKKFAVMEEKVILATILKKFHVSSVQRREDVKAMPAVVLHPSTEIMLSFRPVRLNADLSR